jgi:hypothetical protein
MALSGSQKAYTYARSGIARSGATRSNYVLPFSTVDLIVRDSAGNIVSRTDITPYIRYGSLQVTQALNDEPDTCSFQIVPTAPAAAVPAVGQELAVAWTPGDVLFRGYALVIQFDRRPMNETPWVSVQCQDAMWRFDARIVTYRFPAQSVSASIAFLVKWFCNDPEHPSPVDFTISHVDPTLPALPSFDIVNQRPSTVMRRMMSAVAGAFYIDGQNVHAWAGSLSEPGQTNPQPLTNTLATLKSFRLTQDATQLRKRVLVEGRRASTLIPYPNMPNDDASRFLGLPLNDATLFAPTTGPDARYVARIGTQWVFVNDPIVVAPLGANPPQARTYAAFTPGDPFLQLQPVPAGTVPPLRGWVRVGGQLTRYSGINGDPVTNTPWLLVLPGQTFPYGVLTVPIPADESVEWVDAVQAFDTHGLSWTYGPGSPSEGDDAVRAHPTDTPVVTLAEADRPLDGWPPLEGFVQDGRYSYEGALARANADLDDFAQPIVTAEWETEDLQAEPGRLQAINLTGTSVLEPRAPMTLTITSVEISFPVRTELPRRRCVGGDVKASTFLDLVLTDES